MDSGRVIVPSCPPKPSRSHMLIPGNNIKERVYPYGREGLVPAGGMLVKQVNFPLPTACEKASRTQSENCTRSVLPAVALPHRVATSHMRPMKLN